VEDAYARKSKSAAAKLAPSGLMWLTIARVCSSTAFISPAVELGILPKCLKLKFIVSLKLLGLISQSSFH